MNQFHPVPNRFNTPKNGESGNLAHRKKQTPGGSGSSSVRKGSSQQIPSGDIRRESSGWPRVSPGTSGSPVRLQGHCRGSGAPLCGGGTGLLDRGRKSHGCGVGCVDLQDKSLIYYAVPSDCISSAPVPGYRMNPAFLLSPAFRSRGRGWFTSLPQPLGCLIPFPSVFRSILGSISTLWWGSRTLPSRTSTYRRRRPTVRSSGRSAPRPGPAPPPPSGCLYLYICPLATRLRKCVLSFP